jgi:hypothetical protein
MGKIGTPLPVKPFLGLLTSIPEVVPRVEKDLVKLFGIVDLRSDAFLFDMTHYYDEEMGTPIYRYFISFEKLMEPSEIAAAKVKTNELEALFASEYSNLQRPINLDPGYLEQSKIVLASTKNFFHRILISDGIYAEVTLHFQDGAWQSFPWTFPDYKTDRYHRFFTSLRNRYRDQLSQMGVRIRTR